MSNVIDQNLNEYSLIKIEEDEVIEENKVMVTTGIYITGEGSLTIQGTVRVIWYL